MIRLIRPQCPDPEGLKNNYKVPTNKDALRRASHDKCMYCETKVTTAYFGDIEHIRPKDSFPELKFVWTNLGFVCARCNNAKLNKWSNETPFIDPYNEDPGEHLGAFGFLISHRRGSERGEYTQREIDLNRVELVERRKERSDLLRNLLDKAMRSSNPILKAAALAELDHELAADREYSMVCKAAIDSIR